MSLNAVDRLTAGVPYTHTLACHLLHLLASRVPSPQLVEVCCCYGKATAYLASAAAAADGRVWTVDHGRWKWEDRDVRDLLAAAEVADVVDVTFDEDARWWLLDLLSERPGEWIDLAYLDASHTIEVDAFLGSALWRHLRPGGIMVLDDLDWIPAKDGSGMTCAHQERSHVAALYDYLSALSDVAEHVEWGAAEVGWRWGFIRKAGGAKWSLRDEIARFGGRVQPR